MNGLSNFDYLPSLNWNIAYKKMVRFKACIFFIRFLKWLNTSEKIISFVIQRILARERGREKLFQNQFQEPLMINHDLSNNKRQKKMLETIATFSRVQLRFRFSSSFMTR